MTCWRSRQRPEAPFSSPPSTPSCSPAVLWRGGAHLICKGGNPFRAKVPHPLAHLGGGAARGGSKHPRKGPHHLSPFPDALSPWINPICLCLGPSSPALLFWIGPHPDCLCPSEAPPKNPAGWKRHPSRPALWGSPQVPWATCRTAANGSPTGGLGCVRAPSGLWTLSSLREPLASRPGGERVKSTALPCRTGVCHRLWRLPGRLGSAPSPGPGM